MFVQYQKIENFFKMLETVPKEAIIFASAVKAVSEAGIVSTCIVLQVLKEDVCLIYRHEEDMPVFRLVPDMSFNMIEDDTIRKSAIKSYSESYDAFLRKHQEEYSKMVGLLTGMGFTKIENALVQ
jgi:hypothetical protein